jgi:hypothetical protein
MLQQREIESRRKLINFFPSFYKTMQGLGSTRIEKIRQHEGKGDTRRKKRGETRYTIATIIDWRATEKRNWMATAVRYGNLRRRWRRRVGRKCEGDRH